MRSLRLRVALAAALGVFLAVAALGGAAEYVVRHELRTSQDRGLRGRAVDVARLSLSAPALLTSPGALDAPYGGQDLLVQVVDRQGRIVARSSALGGRLLVADRALHDAIAGGRGSYGDTTLGGTPLRVFVAPLPAAARLAGGGAVLVASSEREIQDTADDVRTLLLLCGLAAAIVGALAAVLLTGRGLAPLRRLTAAAREIERAGDAARRLPPATTRGEVAELSDTLNRMLAALEAAQRSERRFLADASHELRTPVTALRGNVDYLARHGADPETVADLTADVERLARLVDDLLVLERQGQAPPAGGRVALDAVARAAAAAGGVEVCVEDGGPVFVEGDEIALRRALDNLVTNALVHGRPPVRVVVSRDGGEARAAVVDAGPGLAPQDAEAAFERFWRGPASRSRPGTGLGLAIVRAVAAAHGGRAEADGATFAIVLPALPGGGEIVRERSESASSVPDVRLSR
jgi:two-component system, OmpR family, sensor kinase